MVTIKDVAKRANVSIATVSKVVNGYPDVGQKTKQKVMKIIREMKFYPNSVARGLVRGRSDIIGIFLTTGLAHPFFSSVMSGMEETLKTCGYDLFYLAQVGWNDEYSFVQHCMSRNVDGVIVFGFQPDDLNLNELIDAEIPTIFVDLDMTGRRAGYVTSNNRRSIGLAVDYLHGLGHESIAYISGTLGTYTGRIRYEGFKEALKEHGLAYRHEWVELSDFTKEGGYEAAKRILSRENRPTAILCCSDMSAIGAIQAVESVGWKVPSDMSIIGYDNIPLAELFRPSLTTISQDLTLIGRTAINLLIQMIEDADFTPPAVEIDTQFIVRDSSAAPRTSGGATGAARDNKEGV